MPKLSEDIELPPATLDLVDCRRAAEEFPQNFRSQECEVKPFTSFCIEAALENEEFTSWKLEKDSLLDNRASQPPQGRYANERSSVDVRQKQGHFSESSSILQLNQQKNEITATDQDGNLLSDDFSRPWCDLAQDCRLESKEEFPQASFHYACDPTVSEVYRNNCDYNFYPVQQESSVFPGENILSNESKHYQQPRRCGELGLVEETDFAFQESEARFSNRDFLKEKTSVYSQAEDDNINFETADFNTTPLPHSMPMYCDSGRNELVASYAVPMTNNQVLSSQYPEQFSQNLKSKGVINCSPQNPVQMQKMAEYNFYPTAVQSCTPAISGDKCLNQNNRENPAIKLHIHTITHCEVECPASGALSLPNPSFNPFIPNPNLQFQSKTKEIKSEDNHASVMSNAPWNSKVCLARKEDGQKDNFHANEMEVGTDPGNYVNSLQPAYSTPFYNVNDRPHLLVQEQRRTSILIGYPMANNANFNGNPENNMAIKSANGWPHPQAQQYSSFTEHPHNSNDLECTYQTSSQPDTGHRMLRPPSLTSSGYKPKTDHVTIRTSCNPFTSESFPYIPHSPEWFPRSQSSVISHAPHPFGRPLRNIPGHPQPPGNQQQSTAAPETQWPVKNICENNLVEKEAKFSIKSKSPGKTSTTKVSASKKFLCTQKDCPKRFNKERELNVHVNKHHLQMSKPYFCSFCEKNFKRPDQLKRHEKIHTGEKPHACEICGRNFARTDHRNTHYKKHANGFAKTSGKKAGKSKSESIRIDQCNNNYLPEQSFPNEVNYVTKENIMMPLRIDRSTGSACWRPPYFIHRAPLLEGQSHPFQSAGYH